MKVEFSRAGLAPLQEKTQKACSLSALCHMGIPEDRHLKTRKQDLIRHLHLNFSASRNLRNKCLLLSHLVYSIFTTAVWTKTHHQYYQWHHDPSDMMHWEEHSMTSVAFLPKIHNSILITTELQINPTEEQSTEKNQLTIKSSKVLRSWQTRLRNCQDWSRLRRYDN